MHGYALLPQNGRFGATLSIANKVPAQASRRFVNNAGLDKDCPHFKYENTFGIPEHYPAKRMI